MWQRKNGYDAVWRVCGVGRVGIVEGIKGYGGSSIPVFPSIVITALQRHRMPYRSGGHSTAAAIAALGGESNYIDGPRRRRPPPVSFPILDSPARPA